MTNINGCKVLCEKETALGGIWYLVEYGDNKVAYGSLKELESQLFVPVNQCGTKESIKERCSRVVELCNNNINRYKGEMKKDKHEGWNTLINIQENEIEIMKFFKEKLK